MSANSKIEWTDHTFNPWMGCTKVAPACDHCYAERSTPSRTLGVVWGPGQPRRRTSPSNWALPLRWDAQAMAFHAQHGRRQRVFCASLADVFDNEVPDEWRTDLFHLIAATPNLDWLLLTKRIGNVRKMVPPEWVGRGRWPANVRLGITICNQPEADRDVWKLLALGCPNFLSIEPLLSAMDLCNLSVGDGEVDALKPDRWADEIENWRGTSDTWEEDFEDWYGVSVNDAVGQMHIGIQWVIVGGESGPKARPMHPDWARGLRDQCTAAGVPFLFKQWGEWTEIDTGMPQPLVAHFGDPEFYDAALEHDGFLSHDGHFVTNPDWMNDDVPYRGLVRVGKKAAGRLLDGRTWDEVPR